MICIPLMITLLNILTYQNQPFYFFFWKFSYFMYHLFLYDYFMYDLMYHLFLFLNKIFF